MTTEELDNFILENFGGIIKDHPWETDPDFTVFRHADNRKWFALRFFATKEQLLRLKPDDKIVNSYDARAQIDIVNIKIDPDLIEDVVRFPGFLPAFHMNRRHWLTILLDLEVDPAHIKPLLEMSYNLTMKKHRPNPSR